MIQSEAPGYFVELNEHSLLVAKTVDLNQPFAIEDIQEALLTSKTDAPDLVRDFFPEKADGDKVNAIASFYAPSQFFCKLKREELQALGNDAAVKKAIADKTGRNPDDCEISILDCESGKPADAEGKGDLLVCGVLKEDIDNAREEMDKLGLIPGRLKLGAMASAKAVVESLKSANSSDMVLSLAMCNDFSNLFFLKKEGIQEVRRVDIGLDTFFEVIQENLKLKFKGSAAKLLFDGVYDFEEIAPQMIAKVKEALVPEIKTANEATGQPPKKILCPGLSFGKNWLTETFASELALEVYEFPYESWMKQAKLAFAGEDMDSKATDAWISLLGLMSGLNIEDPAKDNLQPELSKSLPPLAEGLAALKKPEPKPEPKPEKKPEPVKEDKPKAKEPEKKLEPEKKPEAKKPPEPQKKPEPPAAKPKLRDQLKDAPEEPKPAASEEKKPAAKVPEKSEKKSPVGMIVAVVVVLALVGAGWYFTMGPGAGESPEKPPKVTQDDTPPADEIPAPPPPPQPGSLVIETEPSGATVQIGDDRTETSPVRIEEMEIGSYPITITMEDFEPKTLTVDIAEATETNPGLIALEPSVGSLVIVTNPSGATVTIDDDITVTSPATVPDLTVGSHTLTASMDGYVPTETAAVVIANAETQAETIVLERMTGAIDVTSTPAGVAFRLEAEPGIQLPAGREIQSGTTPALLESLPTGEYTITFTLPRFDDVSQTVTVTHDETVAAGATFHYGSVTITSNPAGATVIEDGTPLGETPLTLTNLPPGPVTYDVEMEGYEPEHFTSLVEIGETTERTLNLLALDRVSKLRELDSPPKPLNQPEPIIDPGAITQAGHVRVGFTIKADGSVANVSIIETTLPDVDKAIIDAVRQWTFVPGVRNGRDVDIKVRTEFSFNP